MISSTLNSAEIEKIHIDSPQRDEQMLLDLALGFGDCTIPPVQNTYGIPDVDSLALKMGQLNYKLSDLSPPGRVGASLLLYINISVGRLQQIKSAIHKEDSARDFEQAKRSHVSGLGQKPHRYGFASLGGTAPRSRLYPKVSRKSFGRYLSNVCLFLLLWRTLP